MTRLTLAVAAILAVSAVGAATARANSAPPPFVVATYCSVTGDLCLSILRKQGAIFLNLTAAARYFDRYTLCVRPPRGAAKCRDFRLRPSGGFFASSVRWHASFPGRGPGRYRVSWRLRVPLGPPLSFVLP